MVGEGRDLGGARYPIEVVDQFSIPLAQLRQKLAEIRAQFDALKSAGLPFDRLRKSTTDAASAAKQGAQAYDIEAKAIRSAGAEVEGSLVAQRKEIELQKAGITSKKAQAQARKENAAAAKAESAALRAQIKDQGIQDRRNVEQFIVGEKQKAAEISRTATESIAASAKSARAESAAAIAESAALNKRVAARDAEVRATDAALNKQIKDQGRLEQLEVAQFNRRERARLQAEKAARDAFVASPRGQSDAQIATDLARLEKARATIAAAASGRTVLPATLQKARADVRALTEDLESTNRSGNRISFTFRRLFGILAAFALARNALDFLKTLIFDGVKFNAQLEQSQLAIAGIIAATGQVRDATGQAVGSAQAFALAQKESRRQVQLLRVDALRTTATLDELVFAFQTAIGPGIQAGFNIDQIRRFAVQISQAATAIGLPQQQLAEEIRSILQGTIQLRSTRIAAVLGITNEDIRRAKEAGKLVEFLDSKFRAFSRAADESANTLTGIFARLKNAFLLVLGAGSIKLFDGLKTGLKDILNTLVQFKEDDTLVINPKAVSLVSAILDGLTDAVQAGFDLSRSISFEDALATARGIGDVFRVIGTVARTLVQGVSAGLGDVAAIFRPITSLFSGKTGALIGTILGYLIRALTVVSSIGLAIKVFLSPLTLTLALVRSITSQFSELTKAINLADIKAGKLRGTLRGLGASAVVLGLPLAVDKAVREARATLDFFFKEDLPKDAEISVKIATDIQGISTKAVLGIISQEEFVQQIREFRRQIIDEFNKVTDATVKPGSVLDIIDDLPSSIARARQESQDLIDSFKELDSELASAQADLRDLLRFPDATGASLQISQEFVRAEAEIAKRKIGLLKEESEIRAKISAEQARQEAVDERIVGLVGDKKDTLDLFLASQKNLAFLLREQADAELEVIEAQAKKKAALKEGLELGEIDFDTGAFKSFDSVIEGAQEKIKGFKEEIKQLRENFTTILAPRLVQSGEGEKIREIGQEQFALDIARVANIENLSAIFGEIATLEFKINKIAKERTEIIAAQELRNLKDQNAELRLRIEAESRINQSRLSPLEVITDAPVRVQLAEVRNVLAERELASKQALRDVEAELARLEFDKAKQQKAGAFGTGEVLQLNLLIVEKEKERNALLEDQFENITKIKDQLEELEAAAESFTASFGLGLQAAFAQFAATAPDTFQSAFRAMTTALDGIVSIGRDAFASIFDPNSNFEINEALGQLALQLGADLFENALRSLIAGLFTTQATTVTAATEAAIILAGGGKGAAEAMIIGATTAAGILAGASAASSVTGVFPGAALGSRGGAVRDIPIYRARGGSGRHPGRPRGRDTVPAWLDPREFIIRGDEASRPPVLRALQAINEGRVPEGILRIVAGSTRAMRAAPSIPRSVGVRHMAKGGAVGGGTSGGTTVLPAIVASEQMMGTLLTAGEGQLTRWLADRGYGRS